MLTVVEVDNPCGYVLCQVLKLLRFLNSIVSRFGLVEADFEPIEAVELIKVVKVIDFVKV